MQRKILYLLTSVSAVSSPTVAQVTGGSGQVTSIFGTLSQLLGINVANPYNALAMLVTLGVMSLSVYIVLKVGVRKLDIEDVVLPSGGHNGGGRNILALMSVLITLSIFGTGAAAGLIQGFQAMFALGFLFMIIGLGVFIVIGGTGGLFGGGSYMIGKTSKASMEGIKEGSEALDEAKEMLGTAEKEAQDGADGGPSNKSPFDDTEDEEEDAANRIQEALGIMNDVLVQTDEGLESKRNELNVAINEVEEALEIEGTEDEYFGQIDQRFKRANIFLNLAAQKADDQGPGGLDLLNGEGVYSKLMDSNAFDDLRIGKLQGIEGRGKKGDTDLPAGDIYGLSGVREDMANILGQLQTMKGPLETEEHELHDALDKLMDVSASTKGYTQLLEELDELLSEAERDDEMLEKLAESRRWEQLYKEADHELDEEKQLEQKKGKIVGEVDALKERLEKAHDLLQKHLQLDDQMISFIRDEIEHEDRKTAESLKTLDKAVQGSPNQEAYDNYIGDVSDMVHDIEALLEMIEDEDVSEEEADRKVIEDLEQYLYSDS